MQNKLNELKELFTQELQNTNTQESLESLEKEFLGKTGKLKEILKGIKDLSPEEKKVIWPEANKLKTFIEWEIQTKSQKLEEVKFAKIEEEEAIDVTLQYPSENKWHKHPISITSNLLEEIFISLGFKVEDGPQVEDEVHNFDKLNSNLRFFRALNLQ